MSENNIVRCCLCGKPFTPSRNAEFCPSCLPYANNRGMLGNRWYVGNKKISNNTVREIVQKKQDKRFLKFLKNKTLPSDEKEKEIAKSRFDEIVEIIKDTHEALGENFSLEEIMDDDAKEPDVNQGDIHKLIQENNRLKKTQEESGDQINIWAQESAKRKFYQFSRVIYHNESQDAAQLGETFTLMVRFVDKNWSLFENEML